MDKLGSSYLNFTVGPVMMDEDTRAAGGQPIPYFRTQAFSKLMLENEALLLPLANAPKKSRAIFLTGSGTAAMEAAIMNLYTAQDKVLVVNGGSFGSRFVQLLSVHHIPHTEILLSAGKQLREQDLLPYEHKGYTGFVLQHDETSTGTLYDMQIVGDFCRRNALLLTVDCISSFLADTVDMQAWGAHAVIIGSQKAIALPPGISALLLDETAVKRIQKTETTCLYFDLKAYLKDMERGQTPFTPAVGILIQLHERLQKITNEGGAAVQIQRVKERADYFRKNISALPFTLFSESPATAVTALETQGLDAKKLFEVLQEKHHIFICPNGGDLAERVFRVGHIGQMSLHDIDTLVSALKQTVMEWETQQ